MGYDPGRHHRHSVRVPAFDYSHGWFFVTICTFNREALLGDIVDGQINQSAFGHLSEVFWTEIPQHFPNTEIDAFVVMPNHLHGIIAVDRPEVSIARRTQEAFSAPLSGSLATIIRSFKSAATRSINQVRETPGVSVWQKSYYEHVIRNEQELSKIRTYIEANPSRWAEDPENTNPR